MKKKMVVDERELMEMYKAEHYGYWLMFWGLLIGMVVQVFFMNVPFTYAAGEWVVFMMSCVLLIVMNVRKGNWDYYSKPNTKTCFWYALVAAVVFATIVAAGMWFRFDIKDVAGVLTVFGLVAVATFVLIFISLLIAGKATTRKKEQLESQYDEED